MHNLLGRIVATLMVPLVLVEPVSLLLFADPSPRPPATASLFAVQTLAPPALLPFLRAFQERLRASVIGEIAHPALNALMSHERIHACVGRWLGLEVEGVQADPSSGRTVFRITAFSGSRAELLNGEFSGSLQARLTVAGYILRRILAITAAPVGTLIRGLTLAPVEFLVNLGTDRAGMHPYAKMHFTLLRESLSSGWLPTGELSDRSLLRQDLVVLARLFGIRGRPIASNSQESMAGTIHGIQKPFGIDRLSGLTNIVKDVKNSVASFAIVIVGLGNAERERFASDLREILANLLGNRSRQFPVTTSPRGRPTDTNSYTVRLVRMGGQHPKATAAKMTVAINRPPHVVRNDEINRAIRAIDLKRHWARGSLYRGMHQTEDSFNETLTTGMPRSKARSGVLTDAINATDNPEQVVLYDVPPGQDGPLGEMGAYVYALAHFAGDGWQPGLTAGNYAFWDDFPAERILRVFRYGPHGYEVVYERSVVHEPNPYKPTNLEIKNAGIRALESLFKRLLQTDNISALLFKAVIWTLVLSPTREAFKLSCSPRMLSILQGADYGALRLQIRDFVGKWLTNRQILDEFLRQVNPTGKSRSVFDEIHRALDKAREGYLGTQEFMESQGQERRDKEEPNDAHFAGAWWGKGTKAEPGWKVLWLSGLVTPVNELLGHYVPAFVTGQRPRFQDFLADTFWNGRIKVSGLARYTGVVANFLVGIVLALALGSHFDLLSPLAHPFYWYLSYISAMQIIGGFAEMLDPRGDFAPLHMKLLQAA